MHEVFSISFLELVFSNLDVAVVMTVLLETRNEKFSVVIINV